MTRSELKRLPTATLNKIAKEYLHMFIPRDYRRLDIIDAIEDRLGEPELNPVPWTLLDQFKRR